MAQARRITLAGGSVSIGYAPTNYTPTSGFLDGHLEGIDDKLGSLTNPLLFKGTISVAADFPTAAAVETGWFFIVLADVTDNDVTKTNTGQSFQAGDEIVWNGSAWVEIGNTQLWVRSGTDTYLANPGDQVLIGPTSTALSNQVILSGDLQAGSNDALISQSNTINAISTGFATSLGSYRFSSSLSSVLGPIVYQGSGGGTPASPTQTQSGDMIGGFAACGVNDTPVLTNSYTTGIRAHAAQKFTTIAQGTELRFFTVALNTTTEVQKGVLNPAGFLGINTPDPLTYGHFKTGSSAISAVVTKGVLIEGEASVALTLNGNTSSSVSVDMGDKDKVNEGQLRYDNSTKSMFLKVNAADAFEIESDGTLSALTANYIALITADDDMTNKKYVDAAIVSAELWSRIGTDTYMKNTGDDLGVGIALPLSKAHVYESASGATPDPSAVLTIEKDFNPALNILSGGNGHIYYGVPGNSKICRLTHFPATKNWTVYTDSTARFTVEGNGTISVETVNYESLVTSNNDMPNKKYVDDKDFWTRTSTTLNTKTVTDSVKLGASGAADASAILQADSTTKGFLPPRMDTTARDAISTPADGLMIFNTTTKQWEGYDGSTWVVIG